MTRSWIEIFKETVNENGEKIAVIHKEQKWTFDELDAMARIIGSIICNHLDECNHPVVVLLPKSVSVIYADIGILYSCNFFSNLDVKTPRERLDNTLEVIRPAGIITNTDGLELCSIRDDRFVINIDDLGKKIDTDSCDFEKRLEGQIDTDPFCIINTSGSTGTPKGVVLNHRSFFDFMDWSLDTFSFSGDEIIGSLSPVVFDIYDYEICLLMKKGATIAILDAGLAAFPVRLLDEVKRCEVSFIFWVPTVMVNIANMDLLSRIDISNIKTIWFAGEVFPTKQFNYWRRNLPNTLMANLYGPIEITLDCIYYIVDKDLDDEEPIPIGIPCRNTDILILDDDDKLCKDDMEGEICVRGTSLAMGYYNNPQKTNSAFVQNPINCSYPELIYRTGDMAYRNSKDGLIYFKGRKDSLIKHMGYRIELGEIEHVLVNQLKLVKNCCVVYDVKKKEIVVFYEKSKLLDSEMRKQLSSVFPRYMIPTVWIELEELPRNTNGKIDRLRLAKSVNE